MEFMVKQRARTGSRTPGGQPAKAMLSALLFAALCPACAGTEPPPDAAQGSVFVGTATDAAHPETRIAAGIVLRDGRLQFSACGDQTADTLWVRVGGDVDDGPAAETPIDVDTGWMLRGTISGDGASGSAIKRTNGQDLEWAIERVPAGDVGGVYTDGGPCPTEVVVGRGGASVRGSYCSAAIGGVRAQVTPLAPDSAMAPGGCVPAGLVCRDPAGDGIWVQPGDGSAPLLVVRVDPAQR